jgi:hypothetical protein
MFSSKWTSSTYRLSLPCADCRKRGEDENELEELVHLHRPKFVENLVRLFQFPFKVHSPLIFLAFAVIRNLLWK